MAPLPRPRDEPAIPRSRSKHGRSKSTFSQASASPRSASRCPAKRRTSTPRASRPPPRRQGQLPGLQGPRRGADHVERRLRTFRQNNEWGSRRRGYNALRFATLRFIERRPDTSVAIAFVSRRAVPRSGRHRPLQLVGSGRRREQPAEQASDEFFTTSRRTAAPTPRFPALRLGGLIVMFVAFLIRGPWGPSGKRRSGRWLLLFAAAGAVGDHYAYACPEGLSAACRSAEWPSEAPAAPLPPLISASSSSPPITMRSMSRGNDQGSSGWVSLAVKESRLPC